MIFVHFIQSYYYTRMHSSRMRTAHSSSRPVGEGVSTRHITPRRRHPHPREEAPLREEAHPPGADPRKEAPPTSPWMEAPPGRKHPPLLTESQTPVKILPSPNFVAGGNEECNRRRFLEPGTNH